MDNFQTLFEKKEYDLIIKLTHQSSNVDDLFYCLSAYLATNKIDDAINLINDKFTILKTRLPTLMKIDIELLSIAGRFDQAFERISFYQNLPYFSQEAEEVLKDLPRIVNEYIKSSINSYYKDEDVLIKDLTSNDYTRVLGAIDALRERDINPYYIYLSKIMLSFDKQSVRSFCLLFLVQKKIDKEFKFNHMGKVILVNPSKLKPPFVGDDFSDIKALMQENFKDTSLVQTATQILSSYLIYIYPEEVDLSSLLLLETLKIISCQYLSIPYVSEQENECSSLLNDIKEALDNF